MSKYETESGESQAYEYIPSLPKKKKEKREKINKWLRICSLRVGGCYTKHFKWMFHWIFNGNDANVLNNSRHQ